MNNNTLQIAGTPTGYEKRLARDASVFFVPATGVMSNQFLEDLEKSGA